MSYKAQLDTLFSENPTSSRLRARQQEKDLQILEDFVTAAKQHLTEKYEDLVIFDSDDLDKITKRLRLTKKDLVKPSKDELLTTLLRDQENYFIKKPQDVPPKEECKIRKKRVSRVPAVKIEKKPKNPSVMVKSGFTWSHLFLALLIGFTLAFIYQNQELILHVITEKYEEISPKVIEWYTNNYEQANRVIDARTEQAKVFLTETSKKIHLNYQMNLQRVIDFLEEQVDLPRQTPMPFDTPSVPK